MRTCATGRNIGTRTKRGLGRVTKQNRRYWWSSGNRVEDYVLSMFKRPWIWWLVALLGWTAVALFFASQTYLSYRYSGGQAHLWLILKMNLIEWYAWGLLAPGIVWLARLFPLEPGRLVRNLTIHLLAGVGVAL